LPSAIFMAPFEVESIKDQQQLEQQLKTIVSEDNSLTYKVDSDTGQLVVSGLGELHLEIIRDRIIEAGINTQMGKLRIGYRETLPEKVVKKMNMAKTINKQDMWFELELQFIPVKSETD
jgi:elongation factor G